jgi:hypothetical protein
MSRFGAPGSATVGRAAQIVHYDSRAALREQKRLRTADSAAAAGYDCYLAVETELIHCTVL